MSFNSILNTIRKIFGADGIVARFIPPSLICCTAVKRRGLSAIFTAAKVFEHNRSIGIPDGPNADGSANLINKHDSGLIKCIYDSLLKDAVIQVGIPAGSLVIEVNGANAGGQMTAYGTNKTDTRAYGILGI